MLRQIEGDISKLTGEVRALKATASQSTGTTVKIVCESLGEQNIRFNVGEFSGVATAASPSLEISVPSATGSLVATAEDMGGGSSLGSWELSSAPFDERLVSLAPEADVECLVSIKVEVITAADLDSIPAAVAEKGKLVAALYEKRKTAKVEMARLQVCVFTYI